MLAVVLALGSCGQKVQKLLPTAAEVMSLHYFARGGIDRLRSLKTLHRMGEMRVPGPNGKSAAGWYETWQVFPDRIRTDLYLQSGAFFLQGYDGHTAWQVDNRGWRQELTGGARAQLAAQAATANSGDAVPGGGAVGGGDGAGGRVA